MEAHSILQGLVEGEYCLFQAAGRHGSGAAGVKAAESLGPRVAGRSQGRLVKTLAASDYVFSDRGDVLMRNWFLVGWIVWMGQIGRAHV